MKSFKEWICAALLVLLGLSGLLGVVALLVAIPALIVGLAIWVIAGLFGAHLVYWKCALGAWAALVVINTVFRVTK